MILFLGELNVLGEEEMLLGLVCVSVLRLAFISLL